MAEREGKILFSGDASGLARSTEEVKKSIDGIKNVADGLKSGFQAFAAARGVVNDLTEALDGNAGAIAAVVGNLGNMGMAITQAARAFGPWGAAAAAAVSVATVAYEILNKRQAEARKAAEEFAKQMDVNAKSLSDFIKQVDKLKSESGLSKALAFASDQAKNTINDLKIQLLRAKTELEKTEIEIKISDVLIIEAKKQYDIIVNASKTAADKIADNLSKAFNVDKNAAKEVVDAIAAGADIAPILDKLIEQQRPAIPAARIKESTQYAMGASFTQKEVTNQAEIDAAKKEIAEFEKTIPDLRKAMLEAVQIIEKNNGDIDKARETLNNVIRDAALDKVGATITKPEKEVKPVKPEVFGKIDLKGRVAEAPTDELRRIGGIVGNINIPQAMSDYERKDLSLSEKIEQNTRPKPLQPIEIVLRDDSFAMRA